MFVDVSPALALPYILPAQAQKHVTHNEALRILDALVQLSVTSRSQGTPPGLPVEGMHFVVASPATGLWAGNENSVAQWDGTAWNFYPPKTGFTAWVADEAAAVVYDGAAWVGWSARRLEVQELGVSAAPDAQNRLAVSSPATLLNHAGAGHQLKLNKATADDTASLLFQTGFSGRAEMGLAGTDGFGVKSSADGTVWVEALVIPTTGRPEMPQGMTVAAGTEAAPAIAFLGAADTGAFLSGSGQLGLSVAGVQRAAIGPTGLSVDGRITGTAVTQSAVDGSAGRLLKVGDFGIGGAPAAWPTADLNDTTVPSGVYYSTSALNQPAGAGWIIQHANGNANLTQFFHSISAPGAVRMRVKSGTSWTAWFRDYNASTLVGAVSQAAGLPTGAVIEQGSNTNGDYTRFADGTQICTRESGVLTTSLTVGSVYMSASETVAFAAAFSNEPAVSMVAVRSAGAVGHWVGPITNTNSLLAWRLMAGNNGVSGYAKITAIGRWF